jgi:predicted Zn-dependent protease
MAWEAGWGPPAGMQANRRRLMELQSTATGEAAEVVHRLQLYLAFQLNDAAQFRTALDWLIDHHVDKVNEHVNYWRLLVRSGRRSEAQELARRFSRPPETILDALGVASTFAELGLPQLAVEFASAQLKDYPFSSDLWMLLVEQRIQIKTWTELRQSAMNMRNEPALQGKMTGVSSFIEGVVSLRTGDSAAAKTFFEVASTGNYPRPMDAYHVAGEILQLGYPESASKLLKSVETTFATNVTFWYQLTTAAYGSRQMDLMLTAARKTWELGPNVPVYINNYSAVLLALRERPDEAIKLTFRLVSKFPQNRSCRINHCLALIQNGRLDEAEALLKGFNPAALNAVEAASVNLGWFELHLQRGNLDRAREIYSQIDGSRLMESQTLWMAAQFKKIGKG